MIRLIKVVFWLWLMLWLIWEAPDWVVKNQVLIESNWTLFLSVAGSSLLLGTVIGRLALRDAEKAKDIQLATNKERLENSKELLTAKEKEAKGLATELQDLKRENAALVLSGTKLHWNGYHYVTYDGDGPFCARCWLENSETQKLEEKRATLSSRGSWISRKCGKCGHESKVEWNSQTSQLPSKWLRENY